MQSVVTGFNMSSYIDSNTSIQSPFEWKVLSRVVSVFEVRILHMKGARGFYRTLVGNGSIWYKTLKYGHIKLG